MSLGALMRVRALTAWAMRASSSQGWPLRRLMRRRAWRRSDSMKTSRKEARPVTDGWSRLPVTCFQPRDVSWSMKGSSTRLYSGPWLMVPLASERPVFDAKPWDPDELTGVSRDDGQTVHERDGA